MRTFLYIKRRNFRKLRNYFAALALDLAGELLFFPLRIDAVFRRGLYAGVKTRVRKALVVKLDHIGDALVATTAVRALREAHPGARIVALAGNWAAPVFRNCGDVDEVVTMNAPWYSRRAPDSARKMRGILKSLRRERFDLCLVLRPAAADIMTARRARARETVGIGAKGGHFLLTRVASFAPGRPIIEQHAAVLRAAGITAEIPRRPIFIPPPEAVDRVAGMLAGFAGGGAKMLVGIAPEGGLPIKRWRTDGWIETAVELIEKRGAGIVFIGDGAAKEPAARIAAGLPPERVLDLTGRTSVEELGAAIARLDALLTVDSSPRHFAAAFGVPAVVLQWAAMDRGEWAAWTPEQVIVRESLPCDGCGSVRCRFPDVPCMRNITARQVLDALDRALAGGKS